MPTYLFETARSAVLRLSAKRQVRRASPQINDYGPGGRVENWRELMKTAVVARSIPGVSPSDSGGLQRDGSKKSCGGVHSRTVELHHLCRQLPRQCPLKWRSCYSRYMIQFP